MRIGEEEAKEGWVGVLRWRDGSEGRPRLFFGLGRRGRSYKLARGQRVKQDIHTDNEINRM